jgi:SAM-dependent methyltransferase
VPSGSITHLGGYREGGDPNTWYPELWDWAYQELGVRSVLDVGCGEGQSTRYFKNLGCDVLGIDGSPEAVQNSVIPQWEVLHDFTAGRFNLNRSFDLVWSCEFVEHVEEEFSQNFLAAFASGNRYVFMTHAVPGQGGYHHVNCQPSSYWVRRLGEIGFMLDYRLTRRARARAGHGYFRKSGLVFVKRGSDSGRHGPTSLFLALLSLEWFPRRVCRYVRNHGISTALRRVFE